MYKWPPKMDDLGDVVKKYIDDGNPLSISSGDGVYKELEQQFAKLHGRRYGLVVSSGTMALFSAFFAIDIKPGDEVICTSFSFHATASPLLYWGAKIVFCDVEEDTGNIDVECIKKLITKSTKAIVANDQWGHPCDKDKICKICKENGIFYIEDCSHAHFSEYNGKYVGSFGDVACWSFQGSKMLSGGEGGILLTDDVNIYERAVLIGHYSRRSKESIVSEIYRPLENTGFGLKLRMHPLAAVIILHQLNNYSFGWIKNRNETLAYFEKRLQEETPIKPMEKRSYVSSMGAWYGFYPRIDFDELKIDKYEFSKWLINKGLDLRIPTNGILPELAFFSDPVFKINGFDKNLYVPECENAKKYMNSIIGFPTFSFHEYDEIEKYITAIKQYFLNTIK